MKPLEGEDGTQWIHFHPEGPGWTGWMPGEDGVWLLTEEEFEAVYPELYNQKMFLVYGTMWFATSVAADNEQDAKIAFLSEMQGRMDFMKFNVDMLEAEEEDG